MNDSLAHRQQTAKHWFETLQLRIVTALEQLEHEAPGAPNEPHRFNWKPWQRTCQTTGLEGGGGMMTMLKGHLFEKAAVHTSTVFGEFSAEFAPQIPGATEDRHFWASGLSLIVHPLSPHVPTVHMNVRFVVTSKVWFGGGADLTPMLDLRRHQNDPDALAFHAAFKQCCDRHSEIAPYDKYKAWCDDYFFLKHRNEMRGIGGIFYDYLNSAPDGFEADLAFTRDVGETFIDIYSRIVRNNYEKPWGDAERHQQLIRRGRYVEFNLLYDRGTLFGLKTGGNIEAILSSLPPTVEFP